MNIDKEKQQEDVIQDENMLLYKLYNIFSEYDWSKTPKLVFIQEEIANLEKVLRML